MYQPLADALRPATLDDVCGQEHILGENGLLRRIILSGQVPNMIFYGPSGTGKTTVANLIAARTQRKLCRLNATTASSGDIKEIYSQLDTFMAPNGVLLYLDEIQYFNKKQQQTLLEYIENGKITLIASTTENPYFYIYNAILSRSSVFEFKPISPAGVRKAIARAVGYLEQKNGVTADAEPGVWEHVASACGGDIRKAMNAVELLFSTGRVEEGKVHLSLEDAKQLSQRTAMRYDKDGDDHYDCLSALMLLTAFGASVRTVRLGALFLALAFCLGGAAFLCVQALGGGVLLLPSGAYYPVSTAGLLALAGCGYLVAYTVFSRLAEHGGGEITPLYLRANGHTAALRALRDTGNTLRDPITNERVLVTDLRAAQTLLPEAALSAERLARPDALLTELSALYPQLRFRLIPYRAVGTQAGLLLALRCAVTDRQGKRRDVMAAFSPTPVSDGGNFNALTGGCL